MIFTPVCRQPPRTSSVEGWERSGLPLSVLSPHPATYTIKLSWCGWEREVVTPNSACVCAHAHMRLWRGGVYILLEGQDFVLLLLAWLMCMFLRSQLNQPEFLGITSVVSYFPHLLYPKISCLLFWKSTWKSRAAEFLQCEPGWVKSLDLSCIWQNWTMSQLHQSTRGVGMRNILRGSCLVFWT